MSLLRQSQLGLALCLLSLTASPALSQTWGSNNNNRSTQNGGENGFGNAQQLKEQPELPQLPTYSGKCKFAHGLVQSNAEGWTIYKLSILTQEKPDEVRNWYQNTFNMYQWKTLGTVGTTLSAEQKNGNSCYIIVNPVREPVYKSEIRISYMVAPEGLTRGPEGQ